MITVGITGGIGSGKSTVTELFKLMDIPVYIADIESKKLTETSAIIKSKLINLLGEDLYKNGTLDKPKLASIIFSDKNILSKVNNIIHPEVKKDFIGWSKKQANIAPIIAHEAAILFESGEDTLMDKIITVYTPLEVRIERTMQRDGVSRDKALERMSHQMSEEEKIKKSDYVIYNDESVSIIDQTQKIIEELLLLNK